MTFASPLNISSKSLTTVLDLVYVHHKSGDGGDMYFTRFGLSCAAQLALENWYEREWFSQHAQRLQGTSSVFRVPTREVDGQQLNLVVKNCRVGEDVPVETKTLLAFLDAEFNSPWEEFALVMEMREGKFGSAGIHIDTQLPLAIYVPPEKMQIWQSGRSYSRINQIHARHPGIALDILREYKMIYRWIEGMNIVEALELLGFKGEELHRHLRPLTLQATRDLEQKGYIVADMKPEHIILSDEALRLIMPSIQNIAEQSSKHEQAGILHSLVEKGHYSIVDYELLVRTPAHEKAVKHARRHSYLDEMRDRFTEAEMPPYLRGIEILNVPYVGGHVESTGGQLYVVGKHPRLFDYFLPERWRKTPSWRLSERSEIYYTLTKDNVHIVWKTSRVGELPVDYPLAYAEKISERGFNSPFEEFALAVYLNENGVPTVYMRAIYMTGSQKLEEPADNRRYDSHRDILGVDGLALLHADRNYISIRGYFNGPDEWVAKQNGLLCRPIDLQRAKENSLVSDAESCMIFEGMQQKLKNIHCDGSLLQENDLLLAMDPAGELLRDRDRLPEARICNLELVYRG